MALLDVTGGAMLTRLYRSGGLTPVALGLLGFLAYRGYQKRERVADMFGGAIGGLSKIPAMLLVRTDTQPPKRTRKTRSRRKTSASRPRRRAASKTNSSSSHATVH
jgi:hypothetical protein